MGMLARMSSLTQKDLEGVLALRDIAPGSPAWSLLDTCARRELAVGDILLHAGQANDRMHFVLGGLLSVRLAKTSEPLTTIGPGGTVGELSVVDTMPATAFVVAEQPTRVLTVLGDAFWKLVEASPYFARHVITTVTAQVRRSTVSLVRSLDANAELEASAMIDGLTGVYNRRWLLDRCDRLAARAAVDGAPFALFMLDVDHFKKFNDTYGHPAGDAVLVAVAKALVACVRPSDHVARYGGEEFVVVLPGTILERAREVAERTRTAVSQLEVRGTDGAPLPTVTISIGVVALSVEAALAPLIARADALLYEAKKNGRNRVEG